VDSPRGKSSSAPAPALEETNGASSWGRRWGGSPGALPSPPFPALRAGPFNVRASRHQTAETVDSLTSNGANGRPPSNGSNGANGEASSANGTNGCRLITNGTNGKPSRRLKRDKREPTVRNKGDATRVGQVAHWRDWASKTLVPFSQAETHFSV